MRRKIPPIPLEIIMDDPRTIALSSAGIGALVRIAWHFWISECRDLPRQPGEVYAIARAHSRAWSQQRVEILAIMEDAAKSFREAMELRDKRSKTLNEWRQSARGAIALAKAARNIERVNAKRDAVPAAEIKPRLSEKERAARLERAVVKAKEKGFSEKAA